MVTFHVSSDCVAAVLEKNEVLSEEEVLSAVSHCLQEAGCRPWEETEAELYSLGGSQLLLARPCPPVRRRLTGNFPRLKRI